MKTSGIDTKMLLIDERKKSRDEKYVDRTKRKERRERREERGEGVYRDNNNCD
jgi:hypothetical protein